MIKTVKRAVEEMSEMASVEACEVTITHSLAFDKNRVSIDWDNDGNPVLVFTTLARETAMPNVLSDSVVEWANSIDVPPNDLLGALYDAANSAIAFSALKQMVLK
jgi:hypothetical protein